jgi:hypothetical protein
MYLTYKLKLYVEQTLTRYHLSKKKNIPHVTIKNIFSKLVLVHIHGTSV